MYILDSNTFIDAKNRYYAFDIVPTFWDKLLVYSEEKIKTIDYIRAEVLQGKDDLSTWFSDFYMPYIASTMDNQVQVKFAQIAEYVSGHERYKQSEKERFLSKADPWLIAYASVHNDVVVTHEVSGGMGTTKVKIPDICNYFKVPYMNVFEMMRQLNIKI